MLGRGRAGSGPSTCHLFAGQMRGLTLAQATWARSSLPLASCEAEQPDLSEPPPVGLYPLSHVVDQHVREQRTRANSSADGRGPSLPLSPARSHPSRCSELCSHLQQAQPVLSLSSGFCLLSAALRNGAAPPGGVMLRDRTHLLSPLGTLGWFWTQEWLYDDMDSQTHRAAG